MQCDTEKRVLVKKNYKHRKQLVGRERTERTELWPKNGRPVDWIFYRKDLVQKVRQRNGKKPSIYVREEFSC